MRSPPDAHARPFEETERRIETNGLVVRQIRGRSDSRLISVAMLPVQHLDNSQFAGGDRGQPPFAVDHLRQFANDQVMMACSSVEQKQEQASETSVIGQPDVKIENGQMSPEVLWAFGRVGNMCVSPDGKRVAYTVTYYSIPENKSNSEVYVMDADGANKKQLTRTAARDALIPAISS